MTEQEIAAWKEDRLVTTTPLLTLDEIALFYARGVEIAETVTLPRENILRLLATARAYWTAQEEIETYKREHGNLMQDLVNVQQEHARLCADFDSVLARSIKCGDARRDLELEVKRLRAVVEAAQDEIKGLRCGLENRARFIRENAGVLIHEGTLKIDRQRKRLAQLETSQQSLKAANASLSAVAETVRAALLQWKRRDIDGAPCFCSIEPIPTMAPTPRVHVDYCAVARAALRATETP